jgi:hypothetical protein
VRRGAAQRRRRQQRRTLSASDVRVFTLRCFALPLRLCNQHILIYLSILLCLHRVQPYAEPADFQRTRASHCEATVWHQKQQRRATGTCSTQALKRRIDSFNWHCANTSELPIPQHSALAGLTPHNPLGHSPPRSKAGPLAAAAMQKALIQPPRMQLQSGSSSRGAPVAPRPQGKQRCAPRRCARCSASSSVDSQQAAATGGPLTQQQVEAFWRDGEALCGLLLLPAALSLSYCS